MTEKLFYKDTKMVNFTATVVECTSDDKKKGYWIVLDRTAFFPEEGGQSADKGTLGGQEVLDVQITKDTIKHLVKEPLETGASVEGHVDYERRFDFMQQHSGEHILSGLLHTHYDFTNVGFHLSDKEVTLDMDGVIFLEQLREIELMANQIIWKNLPVNVSFPSKEELATMQYRSKIEIEGDVRIVEIPGVDTCACCAPHVASTGEIGIIKVLKVQSHRGGVRINIACGGRALTDYSSKIDICDEAGTKLSVPEERIITALTKVQDDLGALKYTANELSGQLLAEQVKAIPTPSECSNALLFVALNNNLAIRNTVNDLVQKYSGYCGIFAGNDETGYSFIIGSKSKDCREMATFLREKLGAKGGGTAPMIQGSVMAGKDEIAGIFSMM